MMQLCDQIIHSDLGRTFYKMTVRRKIKTIDNKMDQNKAQHNLDKQTAKILTYHQEILVNMNFERVNMF